MRAFQQEINLKKDMHKETMLKKEHGIFAIAVMLIITFCMTIGRQSPVKRDILVYLTFGLNGFVWLSLFFYEIRKRSFSLLMIFWFFCIFFFFFAGLMQTMNNQFPWIKTYDDVLLIKTNVVLLIWTLLFQIGATVAKAISFNNNIGDSPETYNYDHEFIVSSGKLIIFTVFSAIILIYRVTTVGFINLFARGTSSYEMSDNASLNILLGKMMMAIVYFAVVYSVYDYKSNKRFIFLGINAICLLVSYFPTSTARNAIAGIYLGIALAYFNKWKRKSNFIILYSLVFMIVFPLFNAFRTTSVVNVNFLEAITGVIKRFSDEWLAVDYDAYSMVALTLRFIGENGSTVGKQLIGVLLSWVPRSIWHDKPISTGPMIAEHYGWWFTNVSEPLPAEMLANFGIFGAMVASFICGLIVRKLDDAYWNNQKVENDTIRSYDALYYYMVGYCLFIYRGALLSAFAYLVPIIVMWIISSINSTNKLKLMKRF